MFCKHQWEILSETTTKSGFEVAVEAISQIDTPKTLHKFNIKIPEQVTCAERKYIQVFKCDKCGKLKRFVERI
jgi:hypothetical protein